MTETEPDIGSLAEELKSIVEYLHELGVEDLPVVLSQATAKDGPEMVQKSAADRVPGSEIDALVAGLRPEDARKSTEFTTKAPDRNLLADMRLSDAAENAKSDTALPRPAREAHVSLPPSEKAESMLEERLPDSKETLADIRADITPDCQRCELCENRTQVVNSVGNENADLMIIGEAPGADEDAKGEPFVGRAGKLLTKILEAIGFARKDVFIGNINRCRPPKNRQPTLEESAVCKQFLLREIAAVRPKVIVVLGNTATKNLLNTTTGITKLRGKFAEFHGVKVMPTFHPAYLLRDPRKKREVWQDMKTVRDYLNSTSD